MKNPVLVLAVMIVAVCVFPVLGQSAGGSTDTLSNLLLEVRALRIAVERASASTPQVQLLAARLTVQNERLTTATREADAAHVELEKIQHDAASFTSEAAALEDALSRETDPAKLKALKQQASMVKQQCDASVAAEGRLRARDTEFANALAIEQAQWADVNRRLDELERQLATKAVR